MKMLDIDKLVMDSQLQSRVEIHEDLVSEYVEALENEAEFPPVLVYFDGLHHYLADGYHRAHAHKRFGCRSIACEVVNGTKRDAIFRSTGVNSFHGKRPTSADKRKAVTTLVEDFEWSQMSNAAIAKHCNVSVSLVANVKSDLNVPKTNTVKYVTPTGQLKEKKKAPGRPPKEKEVTTKEPEHEFDPRDELIEHLTQEVETLQKMVAINAMDATEEEKQLASQTIDELREKVRVLEIEMVAVKNSRDRFQAENAQLKKQVAAQQKQIKKLES